MGQSWWGRGGRATEARGLWHERDSAGGPGSVFLLQTTQRRPPLSVRAPPPAPSTLSSSPGAGHGRGARTHELGRLQGTLVVHSTVSTTTRTHVRPGLRLPRQLARWPDSVGPTPQIRTVFRERHQECRGRLETQAILPTLPRGAGLAERGLAVKKCP